MTIFVNRSIPLSQESRDAWRNAGAVVLPRRSPMRRVIDATEENVILNLGIGNMLLCGARIWNEHHSIRTVLTPAAIRRTMPDLIPPLPGPQEPAWWKGPGQHGENKRFYGLGEGRPGAKPQGWDLQKHIVGTEYRVITVGNVVVQAYRKGIRIQINDTNHFDWQWVGVEGIKKNGIIPLVKRAVALVPNGGSTVFGWDIIVNEVQPYIIEANSSMGVNDATARRIVEQIRRAQ